MVHEPALIEPALAILEDEPPDHPLVFVTGHTHQAAIGAKRRSLSSTAARSAPAAGNLAEPTDYGLARLIYTTEPGFQPLAADLVTIDPATGSSTARRERLDEPAGDR